MILLFLLFIAFVLVLCVAGGGVASWSVGNLKEAVQTEPPPDIPTVPMGSVSAASTRRATADERLEAHLGDTGPNGGDVIFLTVPPPDDDI